MFNISQRYCWYNVFFAKTVTLELFALRSLSATHLCYDSLIQSKTLRVVLPSTLDPVKDCVYTHPPSSDPKHAFPETDHCSHKLFFSVDVDTAVYLFCHARWLESSQSCDSGLNTNT